MKADEDPTHRSRLRAHRQVIWDAWQKHVAGLPLNALEVRIARVLALHPEYHPLFADREGFLDRDFGVSSGANPYLHISLHIALEEQVAMHQPPEVARALEFLMQKKGLNRHEALHVLLEILGETVYFAQREGSEPDVESYRSRLRAVMASA
jgi:hypothetical protein